jgi:hypothetical protein
MEPKSKAMETVFARGNEGATAVWEERDEDKWGILSSELLAV